VCVAEELVIRSEATYVKFADLDLSILELQMRLLKLQEYQIFAAIRNNYRIAAISFTL
jgi:hypothetical protein